MPLASATKLGPYEIQSLIGAGGMGEVYRARDTRLERTVAIKVINSSVVSSPELKQRFEREARTISRLNHPHVCTLYDVGHHEGTDFLVMEYLEGETLAHRLNKGALALPELLKIAIEILDGLQQAHNAGIVHRDLKPGNVMLTKGGAKLLDFGLAKPGVASGAAGGGSAPSFSGAALTLSSPSPKTPLTSSASVVGTVQYMAPEQFEGKEADPRTDIFAFGCVLYEMATGKRPFMGKSQIKVVSAILEDDPQPVSQLRPGLPSALEHVIGTCLQKIPDNRYHSAHDIAVELRWISEAASERPAPPRSFPKRWGAALLLAGVAAGGLASRFFSAPTPTPQTTALAILPSAGVTLNFSGLYGAPAISPDGTRVVVVGSENSGNRSLWMRSLDRTTLTLLQGTEGASFPFWSPDGKQIGFFTSNALKIVDVAGRSVIDLCAIEQGRGGAWNNRGEIVFGTRTTGLFRIPATGGTPVPLTKVSTREANHRFPTFLPDGEHIVYVVQSPLLMRTQMVSLHDPRPVTLPGVISNVAFSQGRMFHVRADGTLLAQRFNFERLSLEPEIEVVAKPVGYDGQFNYGAFSVSQQGTIAYEEGSGTTANEVAWFDRTGKELGKFPTLLSQSSVRISPRGDQILYIQTQGARTDVWVAQLSGGTHTRISLESEGGVFGMWSPDGRRVAYRNGPAGDAIVVRTSDGMGSEHVVVKMDGDVLPRGWSADGNYIVFEHHGVDPNNPGEIWVAPLKEGEAPHCLLRNIISFGTALSPDSKWLAYTSEESGRLEVYVIPFNPLASPENALAAGHWQISTEGANQPRWSPTGKELFFINPPGTILFATNIKAEAGKLESSGAQKVFDMPLHPAWDFYDIAPDGRIFLSRYVGRQSSTLTMLLNWRPGR